MLKTKYYGVCEHIVHVGKSIRSCVRVTPGLLFTIASPLATAAPSLPPLEDIDALVRRERVKVVSPRSVKRSVTSRRSTQRNGTA